MQRHPSHGASRRAHPLCRAGGQRFDPLSKLIPRLRTPVYSDPTGFSNSRRLYSTARSLRVCIFGFGERGGSTTGTRRHRGTERNRSEMNPKFQSVTASQVVVTRLDPLRQDYEDYQDTSLLLESPSCQSCTSCPDLFRVFGDLSTRRFPLPSPRHPCLGVSVVNPSCPCNENRDREITLPSPCFKVRNIHVAKLNH